MTANSRTRVFISYSHKDERLFNEFRTMLAPVLRDSFFDVWDDTKIRIGTNWRQEIADALDATKVAVLLVSKHFLSSEFISDHELAPLLAAARKDGVTIFWVLLSDCLYQETEIVSYQAAHDPAKPLDLLRKPQRDIALRQVCQKLVALVRTPPPTVTREVHHDAAPVAESQLIRSNKTNDVSSVVSNPSAYAGMTPVLFRPSPPAAGSLQQKDELFRLFDCGFESVLVCGLPAAGKSELVSGLMRARASSARLQISQAPLGATMPGEVWYQVLPGDRKQVIIDPSGEFFSSLSPYRRALLNLPDLTPANFVFMNRATKEAAAVILVFDLTRPEQSDGPLAWRNQENEFHYLLAAIRWLRFDGMASPHVGLTASIAVRASRLPRIDIPVLVAFTKADLLQPVVAAAPAEFARRYLPLLHAALRTHARRYHYDSCQTMIRKDHGDEALDRPIGVLSAFEWLLRPPLRWVPRLPTRLLEGR